MWPVNHNWTHELLLEFVIRPIEPSDVPAVVGLVHELAEYERAADKCTLTEDQLRSVLFGARPALFGHVAVLSGEVVGCALWFLNFSTWRGIHGIYLEDLYVQPAHRGQGVGRALLTQLARECGRARLCPPRMGGARLERARHRFLHLVGG